MIIYNNLKRKNKQKCFAYNYELFNLNNYYLKKYIDTINELVLYKFVKIG